MDTANFDYVIVGAGSAGCVLANRLSESGKYSVLLLESGGSDARFWIKVPIGYAVNFTNAALNWCYHTEPDAQLRGRSVYWPRGKVIGGSSSINAMAYVRGLAHDFDDWAKAGAQGWQWDKVQSNYDRMETQSQSCDDANTRGKGPVWVSDLSDQMSPFSKTFLEAAKDIGLPVISDMNADGLDGVSYYRSTVRHGRRWSSADAFLRPASARKNLEILANAHVERLTFDGTRVTGVRFARGGGLTQVTARKEVIVSAGAINSPKLLQLSGLGPAQLLKKHGVEVLHDLSQVGRGLQDHLSISYQFRAKIPTLNNELSGVFGKLRNGLRYILTRKGPLGVPVNQVGGFVRSDVQKGQGGVPDIQLYCNPASYEMNAAGDVTLDRDPGYLLSAQPCRPTSRGTIEIASNNAQDAPIIQPNSMTTEDDKASAIQAGRTLQNLAGANSLQAVTKSAKGPDLMAMDDAALLEDFQSRATTVFHPTCTCRMGTDATESVLDARLCVHGVAGLRVVDASAFPNITSGNTNAPTMMLAMQAADYILEDAGSWMP